MSKHPTSSSPPARATRVTLRGTKSRATIPPTADEPAFSTRPTERDLNALAATLRPPTAPGPRGPRGEVSTRTSRGAASDAVAGEFDASRPRRPRTWSAQAAPVFPPTPALGDQVFLAMASKREIVVIVNGQELTLERDDALALAAVIQSSFD